MEEHTALRKTLGDPLPACGSPTTSATASSISSASGASRRRSP
jgi:hypothetical protein